MLNQIPINAGWFLLSNLFYLFSFYLVGRATCLVKLEQRESSPANSAPVSSLKNEQLSMDPNERRLHLLLNEQLTELKLMPSAILSILKESSDPPKLVLDVIQVSFYQQLNKGQIGLDENFLRWCILLLKQLMQISPKVDAKLREDAMKLAVVWKLNIGSDKNNSLETVCFLQLLVSFGLTTSFSEDEILKLFENIVLHEQASDLCAKFGFTQKIYGWFSEHFLHIFLISSLNYEHTHFYKHILQAFSLEPK